jgi:23S rRNA pseudouridine1911/1915/1917 synthase
VLCDKLYGGRASITRAELIRGQASISGTADDVILNRQALHARRIKLTHPATGEPIEFTAPLPADLQGVLNLLRCEK